MISGSVICILLTIISFFKKLLELSYILNSEFFESLRDEPAFADTSDDSTFFKILKPINETENGLCFSSSYFWARVRKVSKGLDGLQNAAM